MSALTITQANDETIVVASCECGGSVVVCLALDAGEPAGFDGSRSIPPHYYVTHSKRYCRADCAVTDAQVEACVLFLVMTGE